MRNYERIGLMRKNNKNYFLLERFMSDEQCCSFTFEMMIKLSRRDDMTGIIIFFVVDQVI